MSRNGSGVYSLPAGNPVVTGTTISSSWANTTLSDIASALTGSVAADGQTPMTGNLQMGSNKITGLAAGTLSTDAVNLGQITGGSVAGKFTSVTDSGLTSGRVTYATTGGLLTDSANMTFDGTKLTLANDAFINGLTVGRGAGAVSTNTAVGASAMVATATGDNNSAFGANALNAVTSGGLNTAIGSASMFLNTTGTNNTGVGVLSFRFNTTGSYNTAVGSNALYSNTTASNNTAVGYQASYSGTSGAFNVALGYQAGYSNQTGSNGTYLGYQAGYTTTGSGFVGIGYQAGYNKSGADNYASVMIGNSTGYTTSTGIDNTFVGGFTARYNTTGSFNTALGTAALYSNTTASYNTAVGYQAGYSNTTGQAMAAFGYQALYSNTTADSNSAFGFQALQANTTGASNVAVGRSSLQNNTTGTQNTAVGYQAGYSNTTSSDSSFFGRVAGYSSTGTQNCFIGDAAGYYVTTGSKNTILGSYGGNQGGLDIRTASNYIVLSDGDGNPRGFFDASGTFVVGTSGGSVANGGQLINGGTASYHYIAHAAGTSSGAAYSAFYYNSSQIGSITQSGTTNIAVNGTSDYRLKSNLRKADGINKIMDLNIHKFDWVDGREDNGVLAHELQKVMPELVTGEKDAVDENNKPIYQQVNYLGMIPVMLKAIQELKAEIDSLKAQLNNGV